MISESDCSHAKVFLPPVHMMSKVYEADCLRLFVWRTVGEVGSNRSSKVASFFFLSGVTSTTLPSSATCGDPDDIHTMPEVSLANFLRFVVCVFVLRASKENVSQQDTAANPGVVAQLPCLVLEAEMGWFAPPLWPSMRFCRPSATRPLPRSNTLFFF